MMGAIFSSPQVNRYVKIVSRQQKASQSKSLRQVSPKAQAGRPMSVLGLRLPLYFSLCGLFLCHDYMNEVSIRSTNYGVERLIELNPADRLFPRFSQLYRGRA